jgi:transposase
MANQLSVAKVHSILTLHGRGWSQRRIARELGIDRETVSRHLRLAGAVEAKPATASNALTGSDGGMAIDPDTSNAGGASPGRAGGSDRDGRVSGPTSGCVPYHAWLVAKLEQGLSAVRIHQDLREEHGGSVPSYHSVRRYVNKLRDRSPDPFRRMEVEPGQEAQVDFGTGAPVIDTRASAASRASGGRRRTHVLRVVLSHSRAGYSEVVDRQTTENFIRCIENAFHHFGGVPQTLVLDNLRAAVSRADWFDPELNPKVQSFFAHYGVVALPTKPYTPRHKGKVERGVGYVQANALKGRCFASLAEQNAHLRHWERHIADTRIHGTTQQQVRWHFEQVEKPALRPLPPTRFPCFEEARRTVHRDGHVSVARAYYSLPPEYVGREVWVRYDSRLVRLYDARMRPIVTHTRQEPGRFSTLDQHILDRKIAGVERGAVWLLEKVARIGPQARCWGEALVQERGVEGLRVLQGLLALADRRGGEPVDRACELALAHGCFRLRTVRELAQRDLDPAEPPPMLADWTDEHPIIRPLRDYGRLVHEAFLQPRSLMEQRT